MWVYVPSQRQRSGVPAVGLPPDQCEVAADSGSGAVVDMRNAPPITSPMWAGGPATVGAAAAAAVAAPAAVVVAATAAAAGFPHVSTAFGLFFLECVRVFYLSACVMFLACLLSSCYLMPVLANNTTFFFVHDIWQKAY